MNVLLFGATGMVGKGALLECLEDARVEAVTALVRSVSGVSHPKLREIVLTDFFHYESLAGLFGSIDACLFCLGVSSIGMKEPEYHRVTYELTLAAATAIAAVNTNLTFCYVSGASTDSSENGSLMWARVKGKTENALLAMPFRAAYMFRPGFIQPVKGVRSRTPWVQTIYSLVGVLLPVLRLFFGRQITSTDVLGRALIGVSINGYPKRILEPPDINEAGRQTARTR